MSFAARIKCPRIIGLGLIDTTCPPKGVLAACNAIQIPHKVIIMPNASHQGPHNVYYAALGTFVNEQKGK
jgi:cephalosporin-C deacetylase